MLINAKAEINQNRPMAALWTGQTGQIPHTGHIRHGSSIDVLMERGWGVGGEELEVGFEIPDKPGLGVTLDYDQLARGRERYEKCPYRNRDDTAEMHKHVDPNWKRILPRW